MTYDHKPHLIPHKTAAQRTETHKRCTACLEWKPWSGFHKQSSSKDGHRCYCKQCVKEGRTTVQAVTYHDPPGFKTCRKCAARKPLEDFCRALKNFDGRQSYCRECMNEWKRDNPFARIKAQYGIGEAEYLEMLTAQGGLCAICKSDSPGRTGSDRFHIDHCHTTGAIRGLLCHMCNVMIGCARDNTETLAAGIQYLTDLQTP